MAKLLAVIVAFTVAQAQAEMPLPTVVHTDNGSVLIIPNYTTGQTQAVISTSSTRDKDTKTAPLVINSQKER